MLTHYSISQQGQKHIERDVPCQDSSISKRIQVDRFNCEIVIAAVSDGVGSCEFSQFGSAVAVQSFLQCIEHNIQNTLTDLSDESIMKLLRHAFHYALSQVEKDAEARELPFIEFDSTLTGVIYDGHNLWYGHIGDDGAVVLYIDGEYEMITTRHKGEEAHSVFPLREESMWQFGKSTKEVVSCVLMTDGVLDYCVDVEVMGNRVYFPFLEPALTEVMHTDEDAEVKRLDWDEYLAGKGDYPKSFRESVTDDISFVVFQNPELVETMPEIPFDFDKWDADTEKRKKELDEILYADYRAYKAGTYQGHVQKAAGCEAKNTEDDGTVESQNTGDAEPTPSGNTKSVNPVASGNAKPVNPAASGNTKPVNPAVSGNTKPVNPAVSGNTKPVHSAVPGNARPAGTVYTAASTTKAAGAKDVETTDSWDEDVKELCSDAAQAVKGVIKTGHKVGKTLRNLTKSKKKTKNIPPRKVTSGGNTIEESHTSDMEEMNTE